jgi:hypothetical protein
MFRGWQIFPEFPNSDDQHNFPEKNLSLLQIYQQLKELNYPET